MQITKGCEPSLDAHIDTVQSYASSDVVPDARLSYAAKELSDAARNEELRAMLTLSGTIEAACKILVDHLCNSSAYVSPLVVSFNNLAGNSNRLKLISGSLQT